MDCIEAKSCVDKYINHTLSERKQEEFIKHVESCSECFQELETYFIVDATMESFDDNKVGVYDIRNLLENDLEKRTKQYRRKKIIVAILIVLVVIVVLMGASFLLQWFS